MSQGYKRNSIAYDPALFDKGKAVNFFGPFSRRGWAPGGFETISIPINGLRSIVAGETIRLRLRYVAEAKPVIEGVAIEEEKK